MFDCIIIGAGPAGVAASIFLKRAGFNILLIEKYEIGGLIRNAYEIENYLGYRRISGIKFVELLKNQVAYNKVEIIYDEVVSFDFNGYFSVRTKTGLYSAKTLLIATGTQPKKIEIISDGLIPQKKIFYHISELPTHIINKDIIIIGGGDIAFDYALSLNKRGHNVSILSRSKVKCIKMLKEKVGQIGLDIIESCIFEKLSVKKDKLLLYTNTNKYLIDYLFVAIGREECKPNMGFDKHELCYFIGDVSNIGYRQMSIATGDALLKSMKIEQFLKNKGEEWK